MCSQWSYRSDTGHRKKKEKKELQRPLHPVPPTNPGKRVCMCLDCAYVRACVRVFVVVVVVLCCCCSKPYHKVHTACMHVYLSTYSVST